MFHEKMEYFNKMNDDLSKLNRALADINTSIKMNGTEHLLNLLFWHSSEIIDSIKPDVIIFLFQKSIDHPDRKRADHHARILISRWLEAGVVRSENLREMMISDLIITEKGKKILREKNKSYRPSIEIIRDLSRHKIPILISLLATISASITIYDWFVDGVILKSIFALFD